MAGLDGGISTPLSPRGDAEENENPSGAMRGDSRSSSIQAHDAGGRSPSRPEQWLDRHGDALFRYAAMLVADEHLAEDLVQETLLAALKGQSRFEAMSTERTWLIAILRNKAADHCRRDQRAGYSLPDVDPAVEGNFNSLGKWRKPPGRWTPNPHALVESQEFWAIFRQCMRAIPVNIREAFALRIVEGLDASETCELLKITSANLWTMLFRARERLRRCLETKWLRNGES
jgi:RNA polymerase sigma-70 factor (ECF subfamily)